MTDIRAMLDFEGRISRIEADLREMHRAFQRELQPLHRTVAWMCAGPTGQNRVFLAFFWRDRA